MDCATCGDPRAEIWYGHHALCVTCDDGLLAELGCQCPPRPHSPARCEVQDVDMAREVRRVVRSIRMASAPQQRLI